MWKIYKEGQGKWARGFVVSTFAILSVYGVAAVYGALPEADQPAGVGGWSFDYRLFVGGPLLIALAAVGVWLFNHPPTTDFLIETENELKNKVVWPSRQEEINASLVVLTTVVIFMLLFLGVDVVFNFVREVVYNEGAMNVN